MLHLVHIIGLSCRINCGSANSNEVDVAQFCFVFLTKLILCSSLLLTLS